MEQCRLCLINLEENAYEIFNSYIDNLTLLEVIEKHCYKITIKEDDKFSHHICDSCYEILQNACYLCERSAQAEKELHMMIPGTTIKEEQSDYDDDLKSLIICQDVHLVKPDVELIEGPELDMSTEDNPADDDEEEDKKPKPKKKKHQCLTCLKFFEKPSKLARHEKTHDVNRKPFACQDCFQRFATPESLERHKIIHSGMTIKLGPDNKTWPCIICSKVFDTQTTMASHMRIHKDEMEKLEFPCNLCDRVFQKLNDLTR